MAGGDEADGKPKISHGHLPVSGESVQEFGKGNLRRLQKLPTCRARLHTRLPRLQLMGLDSQNKLYCVSLLIHPLCFPPCMMHDALRYRVVVVVGVGWGVIIHLRNHSAEDRMLLSK